MKITKKRIPFGGEQQLIQQGTERCVRCMAVRGENHGPGCDGEECPQCGCMVIGCPCDCLSAYDSAGIILGLYRKFSSLTDALADIPGTSMGRRFSYLEHAAVQYIFENVNEETRNKLITEFRKKFPDLVPHVLDGEGVPYYTADQLSESLKIPLHEVQEKINAMVEAGNTIRFSQAVAAKKTQ